MSFESSSTGINDASFELAWFITEFDCKLNWSNSISVVSINWVGSRPDELSHLATISDTEPKQNFLS